MVNVNLIAKFLNENNIEYKLANTNSDSFLFSDLGFTYGFKAIPNEKKLIFSDKKLDIKLPQVICDKPKYVMYYVLFNMDTSDQNNENQYSKLIKYKDSNMIRYDVLNSLPEGVVIGNSNVIGGIPFSFYEVKGKKYRAKPLKSVVIKDYVHISNGNVIDSGIFEDTILEKNVKVDSNVYIAHDVSIGENSIVTSGVSIGGHSKIGKNCYLGMNSVIRNGVSLGDNVIVGMGAVITKSFKSNVTLIGNPAKPLVKNK